MADYLLNSLHFEYVLLGKIQSDDIEGRFGKYRSMSGGNYHVTVTQILESEHKLKLLSILKLNSSKFGEFHVKDFLASCTEEDSFVIQPVDSLLFRDLDTQEINITENEIQVLIYIGGYIVQQSFKKKIKCVGCQNLLCSGKGMAFDDKNNLDIRYEYLKISDRGGLKYPTPFLIDFVIKCYTYFQNLISARYETDFLKVNCQKSLIIHLVLTDFELIDNCEECGIKQKHLLEICITYFTNILLNNYSKKRQNDIREQEHDKSVNRKLKKLSST